MESQTPVFAWNGSLTIKLQIPLRTPQRPQPVFDPNGSVYTFCCHKCTHFAWPIYTYLETCRSNTLLGPVVRRYCCTVIQSLYACTTLCCYYTHFALHRLVEYTLCFDQLYSCPVIMLSSLCTPVGLFVVTSALI